MQGNHVTHHCHTGKTENTVGCVQQLAVHPDSQPATKRALGFTQLTPRSCGHICYVSWHVRHMCPDIPNASLASRQGHAYEKAGHDVVCKEEQIIGSDNQWTIHNLLRQYQMALEDRHVIVILTRFQSKD
jgi:hypothetical protein